MAHKQLLTLENLYDYYQKSGKSIHFSSSDEQSLIVVQVEGSLKFAEQDKNTEGLLPVVLKSCHTLNNLNHSFIAESVMTKALPSFCNRPILGYIHDVDGQSEFYGHNMHVDEDGNIVYDEVPVGIIPESCNARLEYDEENQKNYVVVNGYVFEEYSKASEILRREEECNVSVELAIREMSYDAKEKLLIITDFFFQGVTILGKNEDGEKVRPGMAGSNIKLSDFSRQSNSLISHNEAVTRLIEILDKLGETIADFNMHQNCKEGGISVMKTKFEELLEKYNKTADDISFEYEGMTDEELEAKFEELFGESQSEGDSGASEGEDNTDGTDSDGGEGSADGSDGLSDSSTYTLTMPDGSVKTFELSLNEIQCALHTLVNNTYGDVDNAWYSVDCYDDYVVMVDYWNNKAFKQSYERNEDVFTLTGDRVEVFANWLTKDEEQSLKDLRSNYASIQTQLEKYQKAEEAANKKSLISSADYSSITDKEDFTALVKSVNEETDGLTFEELKSKCDELLLNYVKSGSLTFANNSNPEKKTGKTHQTKLPVKSKKKSRYGSLFSDDND